MKRWWLKDKFLLTIVYVIFLTAIKCEEHCRSDLTISRCSRSDDIVYIQYGQPLELHCVLRKDPIDLMDGNDSRNLYFTQNNDVVPNDMVQVLNSTAIKLRIEKPPKSESFYACKLRNYFKPICWNAVIVASKPPFINDFNCSNYDDGNFVCTWTRPNSTTEISYSVTYSFLNRNNEFIQKKCLNLVHHEDSNKISCLWTLPVDPHHNYTQLSLLGRLNMTNAVGSTVMNKEIVHLQPVTTEPSESCPCKPHESTPTNPTVTSQPTMGSPIVDESSRFKVLCYIDNDSWHRDGIGKFAPNNIDPELCTHIVYTYVILDENLLTLRPAYKFAESEKDLYNKVTAYKAKGIKVLLGFIGWAESINEKYSRLINDVLMRKQFIANAVDYIEKNNFDGLDIGWHYPKCWQAFCNKGPDSDKPSFAAFVKELHEAFAPKNLLLTAQVSRRAIDVDLGYDVPTLSHYLDLISVMSFNYKGPWNGITGHLAALSVHEKDTDLQTNANFSINYWIQQGADRKKILMGIPAFGHLFNLVNEQENDLNAHTNGGRRYSIYEICKVLTNQWVIVQDYKHRKGPYAYFKNEWISFDDVPMIEYKSKYIKSMNLGGASISSLDVDDFNNVCGCGAYPLLKSVNRVLRNYSKPIANCQFLTSQSEEHVPEAVVY